jgi:hypothetical protein
MGVVVERVDLSVAGRADLNRGTGIETLAFRLLTRNQMVFGESGHLSMAKFAGLRHRLAISGWWETVTRSLILAIALPVRHHQPIRFTSNTRIYFMTK